MELHIHTVDVTGITGPGVDYIVVYAANKEDAAWGVYTGVSAHQVLRTKDLREQSEACCGDS